MFSRWLGLLFLLLMVASCSQQTGMTNFSDEKSCKPDVAFAPNTVEVNAKGLFNLKDNKFDYNYDLKNKNWTCGPFQSPSINSFYGKDAKQMSYALVAK